MSNAAEQLDRAYELTRPHRDAYDGLGYGDVRSSILMEGLADIRFTDQVDDARQQIDDFIVTSSVRPVDGIFVKNEGEQPTSSFKVRGATYFMLKREAEVVRRGVITASSGNHAQGVAFTASKLGATATLVMPKDTPQPKIDGSREHGGRIVLQGDSLEAAQEHAKFLQKESGALYVPPYDHADIVVGQATIAAELWQQMDGDMDEITVAAGGCGLLAGLARYIKTKDTRVKVWGAGVEDSCALTEAFRRGGPSPVAHLDTLAEGVKVRQVGKYTFEICKRLVEGTLEVSHDELRASMANLYEHGLRAEGAGALGFAAAKEHNLTRRSPRVATVLSGANVSKETLVYAMAV